MSLETVRRKETFFSFDTETPPIISAHTIWTTNQHQFFNTKRKILKAIVRGIIFLKVSYFRGNTQHILDEWKNVTNEKHIPSPSPNGISVYPLTRPSVFSQVLSRNTANSSPWSGSCPQSGDVDLFGAWEILHPLVHVCLSERLICQCSVSSSDLSPLDSAQERGGRQVKTFPALGWWNFSLFRFQSQDWEKYLKTFFWSRH